MKALKAVHCATAVQMLIKKGENHRTTSYPKYDFGKKNSTSPKFNKLLRQWTATWRMKQRGRWRSVIYLSVEACNEILVHIGMSPTFSKIKKTLRNPYKVNYFPKHDPLVEQQFYAQFNLLTSFYSAIYIYRRLIRYL